MYDVKDIDTIFAFGFRTQVHTPARRDFRSAVYGLWILGAAYRVASRWPSLRPDTIAQQLLMRSRALLHAVRWWQVHWVRRHLR